MWTTCASGEPHAVVVPASGTSRFSHFFEQKKYLRISRCSNSVATPRAILAVQRLVGSSSRSTGRPEDKLTLLTRGH